MESIGGTGRSDAPGMKPWNDFFSPAYPDNSDAASKLNKYSTDGEFEFYMQIGSKFYPEQIIRSHGEAIYQLKKCLGLGNTAVHNFDISGMEYRTSKFVIGIDTERITEAGWTGLNTRAGDLLTVNFKLLDTNGADERKPDRMHVVLHADLIMQVHRFGISVLN